MLTSVLVLLAVTLSFYYYLYRENRKQQVKLNKLLRQDQNSEKIKTEVVFKKVEYSGAYNHEGFEIRYALKIKGTNGLILMKKGSYEPLPAGDSRLDDGYLGTLTFTSANPGSPDGYSTSFIPLQRPQNGPPLANKIYKFDVVDLTTDPEKPANGQDTREP